MQFGLMGGGLRGLVFKDSSWDLPKVNVVGMDHSPESTRSDVKHHFESIRERRCDTTFAIRTLVRPNSTLREPWALQRQYDASVDRTDRRWSGLRDGFSVLPRVRAMLERTVRGFSELGGGEVRARCIVVGALMSSLVQIGSTEVNERTLGFLRRGVSE